MAREGYSHIWMYNCLLTVAVLCVSLTNNLVRSQGQCQPIRVPICKGLHWNITMFPNHMRQTTQEEAGLTVQEFYPLVRAKCSPYLQQLICAIYTPPCTWDGSLIPACKSLCISVRDGCAPVLKKFGIQWPFNCDMPSAYIAGDGVSCMDTMLPSTTGIPENTIRPTEAAMLQSTVSSGVQSTGRCESVSIPLCEDVTYKTTLLPNNLGHPTQEIAGMEAHQFFPLVKALCSPFLKNFLCAVYAPPCIMLHGKPLPVCRSLCIAARRGCADLMARFGFEWPESLACDSNSYIVPDNQTCFGYDLQTTPMATTLASTMTPTRSRCERLESSVCTNLPWNVTHVPNFLLHKTQRMAEMDIREYSPIIEMQCSSYTKLLLCGIYSSKCEDGRPVPVCRSLCLTVRETCEPMYEQFGFAWPRELRCDNKKYIVPDDQICIGKNLIPTAQPNTMHWRFTEARSQIVSTLAPSTAPPAGSLVGRERCEPIRVPMCKKLPWRHTQMPNFAGHASQKKARAKIRNFIPLVRYGCSRYLKLLVCAVYEPKCDTQTNEKVPICASLCNLVKNQCSEVLNAFKLPWSDDLDCEQSSYIVPDNQTCVGVPGGLNTTVSPGLSPDPIATTYRYKRKPTPDVTQELPITTPVVTTDQVDRSQSSQTSSGPGMPSPQGATRTTVKPKTDSVGMSTPETLSATESVASKSETDPVVSTQHEDEVNGVSTVAITRVPTGHYVEKTNTMPTKSVPPATDSTEVPGGVMGAKTTESERETVTMSAKIITKDPIMESHKPTPASSKVSTMPSPTETVTNKMQKGKTETISAPLDKNIVYSTEESLMIKSTKSEKDIMDTTKEYPVIHDMKTTESDMEEIIPTESDMEEIIPSTRSTELITELPEEASSKHMPVTKDNVEPTKKKKVPTATLR